MQKIIATFTVLIISLGAMLTLMSCSINGGGDSNTTIATNSSSKIISGTASQGAPIYGTVVLKDSKGLSKIGTIDSTTGAYSIVVDGLTAPYILKAGSYYSVASSATTTNINPLTDLCVKSAAGTTSVDAVFTDPTQQLSAIAAKLSGIVTNLKSSLDGIYPTTVPTTMRDFMNGSLAIDQGADFLLSKVSISSNAGNYTINYNTSVVVTITVVNSIITVTPSPTVIAIIKTDIGTEIQSWSNSTVYSSSDLVGTWNFSIFRGGSTPRWMRVTYAVDATGAATSSNVQASSGEANASNMTLAITPSGVIVNTSNATSTGRLVMSQDKNLMVGVGNSNSLDDDSPSLYIAIKTGGTFQQSDLTGNWKQHSLFATTSSRGWVRGDMIITGSGVGTLNNLQRSNGNTSSSPPLNLSINTTGVVSATTNSFYGAMSQDKNMIVSVLNGSDGEPGLALFVKTGGTVFSQSDVVGTWRSNWLSIGATASTWARSFGVISSDGSESSYGIVTNYGSEPNSTSNNVVSVSSTGLITVSDQTKVIEGIFSLNKKLMVYTGLKGTSSAPQYQLGILMK